MGLKIFHDIPHTKFECGEFFLEYFLVPHNIVMDMNNVLKFDIQCHMVFNATLVTLWMTLLMNK